MSGLHPTLGDPKFLAEIDAQIDDYVKLVAGYPTMPLPLLIQVVLVSGRQEPDQVTVMAALLATALFRLAHARTVPTVNLESVGGAQEVPRAQPLSVRPWTALPDPSMVADGFRITVDGVTYECCHEAHGDHCYWDRVDG